MMTATYDHVSIDKHAHIGFADQCITRTLYFADGSKKQLGLIQPCSLQFMAKETLRIELISGICQITCGEQRPAAYRSGQSFFIDAQIPIRIDCEEYVQFICHFEG